jgi:hypothetical protein
MSWDVGIAKVYGQDGRGSVPGRANITSPFPTDSRPALVFTKPLIQWVPWLFSPGVKRLGCETD